MEQTQKSNEYVQFFSGQQLALAGNSSIVKIDLRLPRDTSNSNSNSNSNSKGMLALDVDGKCITVQQVSQQFSDLAITGVPRGGSLEEATTFTTNTAWGKISFGFQQKKSDCLGYLVFNPGE
ncbi:hypothetical protein [Limnobacter parvus]|uniref:Uncharacterized protein n=1 Tax=Limnobacter parvus TaxID=2939690 RepID=A0ABT1XFT4_9BURK|nr:hypothetical protein [Limnobacter parvus]MCR2746142.1 hypothetical protein [Limnobacter parvus]